MGATNNRWATQGCGFLDEDSGTGVQTYRTGTDVRKRGSIFGEISQEYSSQLCNSQFPFSHSGTDLHREPAV